MDAVCAKKEYTAKRNIVTEMFCMCDIYRKSISQYDMRITSDRIVILLNELKPLTHGWYTPVQKINTLWAYIYLCRFMHNLATSIE